MIVIKVKLDDLIPYENNAKLHPQEQIEQIKNSIIEFGNNDPIAIDENNIIIEGHGRYKALLELGYEETDCIKLENLSEDQKKAYRIVHNKLTMNTDWNMDRLKEELDSISLDMSIYDFLYDDEPTMEELDREIEEDETFIIKITFENYNDWLKKENDFRKLVENSNATMVVGSV